MVIVPVQHARMNEATNAISTCQWPTITKKPVPMLRTISEERKCNYTDWRYGSGYVRRTEVSDNYLDTRWKRLNRHSALLDLQGKTMQEQLDRRINDSDLGVIMKYLFSRKDITHLDLSCNNITAQGYLILANFMKSGKVLLCLDLSMNLIKPHMHRAHLYDTLLPRWNLGCLKVHGNDLGGAGGKVVGHLIRFFKGKHLDLGNTNQTVQSVSYIIESFIEHLQGNLTVTKLNLNRILGTHGDHSIHLCHLLSQMIKYNRTIEELHLCQNEIWDHALEILVTHLNQNEVLKTFNLSGNLIHDMGGKLLAQKLPRTNITHLLLNHNHIRDGAAIALSKAFPSTPIVFLDVSYNEITEVGLCHLFNCIDGRAMEAMYTYGNRSTKTSNNVIHDVVLQKRVSSDVLDIVFWWNSANEIQVTEKPNVPRPKYRFDCSHCRDEEPADREGGSYDEGTCSW